LEVEGFPATPVVESTLAGRLEGLRVAVPADARLNGGRLEWIPGSNERGWWPDGGDAPRALWEFIDLASADDERVLAFVRRYGVLGLTDRGLPGCGVREPFAGTPQLAGAWQGWAVSWEPVAAYRLYATGMRAILAMAVALQRGAFVDPARVLREAGIAPAGHWWDRIWQVMDYWREATGLDRDAWWDTRGGSVCHGNLLVVDPSHIVENFACSGPPYEGLTIEAKAQAQRRKLAHWVTDFWVARSGLAPIVVWDGDQARLCLSVGPGTHSGLDHGSYWPPNSLFRVMVAHLAALMRGGVHSATCANCGSLYFKSRRVRPDQPGHCPTCEATAASRRTRRWRERSAASYPDRTPTHTPTAANDGGQ
jgi:hypothetical protein